MKFLQTTHHTYDKMTTLLKYGVSANIMQDVGSCSKLRCEHQASKRMVIFLMSIWNNEWKGNISKSNYFTNYIVKIERNG